MRLERQVAIKHPVGTSAERRHNARVGAQVALCRVIVAILFTPAVIIACGVSFDSSTEADALRLVRGYAYEAFPQWAQEHHEQSCPRSVDDLSPIVGRAHANDPWGTPLELRCGPGIRGAYIRSAGPDRTLGTADDITSND